MFAWAPLFKAHGQETYVKVIDATVSQYSNGSYLAMHSVTLAPGFSFTATASGATASFHVYIEGKEPIIQDATIPQNNIVRSDIIKVSGIHSDNDIIPLTNAANQIQTQYTYIDGMARPIQSIQSQQSPLGKDIVQPVVFDSLGRPSKQYLPYTATTTNGSYQTNAIAAQAAFYNTANQKIATDGTPFATTSYDKSPLEQVTEQGAAGADWQIGTGHTIRMTYRLNIANEVLTWNASGTSGYYAANLLAVTETLNENGNKATLFKNQLGQVILKRVAFNENVTEDGVTSFVTNLDTYFIYDDLGRLIYQVPPKAVAKIAGGATWNTAFISQWVFSYIYDANGRLVEKDVPGAAPVYMVYNQMDQLVMSQNGKLRSTNRWYFVKYDQAQRPVISGIYTYTNPYPGDTGTPQAELQKLYNSFNYDGTDKYYEERLSTGTHAYTTQSFPTSGLDIESVNYYDSYDIYGSGTGTANFSYQPQGLLNENTVSTNCNGILVAAKVKVVGSNNRWLVKVNFFDKYGRTIQQIKNNHLIAADNTPNPSTLSDITTTVYNFDGTIAINKTYKKISTSNTVYLINKLSYDNGGRLSSITQSNNGSADQVVGKYVYNELGQLVDRKLHQKSDGTYLQSVDYRYNIRGWLASINSADLAHNNDAGDPPDLFGMELSYDNTEAGFIDGTTYKPYYTGQIAAVKWKVASDANTTRPERSYRYTYDAANRLRKAYSAALSGTTWSTELGGYNENADYDQNGNVLHIDRNTVYNGSVFTMDNLTYSYTASGTTFGNQLQKVDDAVANTAGMTEFKNNASQAIEYTYDADGNLLTDANKGSAATPVNYTYNDINKVSKVDFGSGNYVTYTYDAAGNRLERQVFAGNTITNTFDYLDGFIYQNSTIISLPMPEGRVTVASGVYQYEYIIKDHQQNARASFVMNSTTGAAQLVQENHYYPFGMTLMGPTINTISGSNPNQFLYNGGSELQQDNGSNIYSTFYREYDPAVGRFQAVDIDADSYSDTSPYAFASNNPVMFNDPMGSDPWDSDPRNLAGSYYDPINQWQRAASTYGMTPEEIEFARYHDHQQAFLDWANTKSIIGTLQELGFVQGPNGNYVYNGHTLTEIYQGQIYDVVQIPGAGPNQYQIIFPTDDNNLWRLNGYIDISKEQAYRTLGIQPENSDSQGDDYTHDPMFYANAIVGFGGATLSYIADAHTVNDIYHIQQNGIVRSVFSAVKNNSFVNKSWTNALGEVAKYDKYAKGLALVSAGLTVVNVINNRAIKPSDLINGAMAGISVSGFGSLIAGGYFLLDIGLKVTTGKSLGDRIDESLKTPDHALVRW